MLVSDFDYQLPPELIAQYPLSERSASRLLVVADDDEMTLSDAHIPDFLSYVNANDLLVFNNTKVIPARLYGRKASGGQVEVLVERLLPAQQALVHLRVSKKPAAGSLVYLDGEVTVKVLGREGELFLIEWQTDESPYDFLDRIGHLPLPPYIERSDEVSDKTRYQTVFAQTPGAVAAPTAGLHFDQALLDQLNEKGVKIGYVTLHVGAGTFQPVRVDRIEDHVMHAERVIVSEALVDQVRECKARGGRVIAVGTTVVRSLESAALSGVLQPFSDDTKIFITPGFEFKVVDMLVTNFHLPQSTLLMLVSAFSGIDRIQHAYQHAITQAYRFFSYGDAMLLTHHKGSV